MASHPYASYAAIWISDRNDFSYFLSTVGLSVQ